MFVASVRRVAPFSTTRPVVVIITPPVPASRAGRRPPSPVSSIAGSRPRPGPVSALMAMALMIMVVPAVPAFPVSVAVATSISLLFPTRSLIWIYTNGLHSLVLIPSIHPASIRAKPDSPASFPSSIIFRRSLLNDLLHLLPTQRCQVRVCGFRRDRET